MDGKILIVDDEEGIRNSLGDYFNRQGFTTILAENGLQALERVRETKPDVVILDVQIPFLDGLEVCKKIRRDSGEATGIIMISGSLKETVDRVVGLELGADIYLPKPLDLTHYKGRVGDPISIQATDDIGMADMKVNIVSNQGAPIENGQAVETGAGSGKWTYTATAPVALGADIFIEVTGVDHAGNRVKITESPRVGEDD